MITTEPVFLTTTIPFPGFYETTLSEMPDRNLLSILDDAPVKTASEIWDLIHDTKDYYSTLADLSRLYLQNFQIAFNQETGLNIEFTFDALESPTEYNFTTDRLFAKILYSDAKKMYRHCDKERLSNLVRTKFTSRSGFISGYSNNLAEWQNQPILNWDHNQLGTVLECVCDGLEGLRHSTIEQEVESLIQDDYGNGNGPNIDDDVYTSLHAKTKQPEKVARLKLLLNQEFERARGH